MTSLVVPGLDTLRQWLDDLGMSFFECDNGLVDQIQSWMVAPQPAGRA